MKKKKKDNSYKYAIVVSEFNKDISEGLLKGAIHELKKADISDRNFKIFYCPGAFEIASVVKKICKSKKYDAVICLGAVIKGETAHFEFISFAVVNSLIKLIHEFDIPVTFGVLTCYNYKQALERSSDDENNKGREAARAAIAMVKLLDSI